ncbi:MAG: two-component sensor histidine kinase [Beijerinckiaceae bacterium]|nr:two-component sensor histidine kinase [Beijerinckiaceae bacterium]
MRSQLTASRLALVFGGLLVIVLALAKSSPNAFILSGSAFLLASYAIALRGRILARRVSAKTHKLEGFPARLTVCLDAVPEPLIIIDNRALVVFANAAARSSLPNCKENNPVSFALRAPLVLNAVDQVLRGERMMSVEYHERVPVERFFEVTVARIDRPRSAGLADPQEMPRESVVILMRDITQLQRIQNMRVDFIANASHELRTPLASIIGFIETLQGPAKNDLAARDRFLSIMVSQARRMARLVDDLLSLSRIELTQHVAPSEKVDIVGVLGMMTDTLSGLARERGVEIETSGAVDQPIHVLGDRDELLRVFENLIENAIKYGKSGKRVVVSVERRTAGRTNEVEIAVQDFGPGIPPEHVPRLTERFYRVDVGASHEQGGTGLGLAIVKHIINRHRGRLAVDSRLGEGSRFTVSLPVAD